jgi:hypothetical protein
MSIFEQTTNFDATTDLTHKNPPVEVTIVPSTEEIQNRKVLYHDHQADAHQKDNDVLDAVREKLSREGILETWYDPEEVHEERWIGFDVKTQEAFQAQGQEPLSVEYRLSEDGSIREFLKIEFSSAYGNFALMEAVKSQFESAGIPVEQVAGEARFWVQPGTLNNPQNIEPLKQIMQVGRDGDKEYINTKLSLDSA